MEVFSSLEAALEALKHEDKIIITGVVTSSMIRQILLIN